MDTFTRSDWADGAKTSATAYLWIPEHTQRVRGLLILGSNVPENMLVGNAEVRSMAAANNLAIVWSTPSFWYFKAKNEDARVVSALQELLNDLARTSGYDEIATVPWIPLGESGHLLMVDALVEAAPERCLAAVWLKNPHLPPHNRTVPALVIFGTAQEWGQDKADYETHWKNTRFYDTVLKQRQDNPSWPLTFVIDGSSGHFDVSDRLVHYVTHYIDAVVKARLTPDPKEPMKLLYLKSGYVAGLTLAGYARRDAVRYSEAPPGATELPWFPDRSSAVEAQSIAAINWEAASQLPAFTCPDGVVCPFDFNGISSIVPHMKDDGITFRLKAILLDKQPSNFLHTGEALIKGPSAPTIEWLSGAIAPRSDGTLQVSLDRTWRQQAIYYAARVGGTSDIRAAVQPIAIKLKPNDEGKPQKISFAAIKNVSRTAASTLLSASSDAGLPVRFFVVAGPAYIEGNWLLFTPLPPRTKFPVAVTAAAWQWGRENEPKVRTAETVRQTFLIEK